MLCENWVVGLGVLVWHEQICPSLPWPLPEREGSLGMFPEMHILFAGGRRPRGQDGDEFTQGQDPEVSLTPGGLRVWRGGGVDLCDSLFLALCQF